jgi:hypothetical protein
MPDLKQQQICIKFCSNWRKNATKTSEILKVAFGEQKVGRKVCQWFSNFNRGIPLSKTPNV